MKLEKLGFKALLNISSAVMLVLFITMGVFSIVSLTRVVGGTENINTSLVGLTKNLKTITDEQEPVVRALGELKSTILKAQLSLYMVVGGFNDSLDEVVSMTNKLVTDTDRLGALVSHEDEEKQKEHLKIKKNVAVYAEIVDELATLDSQTQIEELGTEGLTFGKVVEKSATQLETQVLNEIKEINQKYMSESFESVKSARLLLESAGTTRSVLISAIAVSVSMVIAFAVFLPRILFRPIYAMRDMLRDIAENNGDLTKRIEVKTDDEIGELAKWFNTFIVKIHDIISLLDETSIKLSGSSTELSSFSQNMVSNMSKQTEQSLQIATAMEEMSITISEVSNNTAEAANKSNEANDFATEGGAIVSQAIQGMNDMAQSVNQSSQNIAVLGKSSKQIGEIISVINDIADQTNLLALNAAIEAARAGEQGRGFAVVADEVRKLAENTTKATKEISDMVGEIQSETDQAVKSMDTVTKDVQGEIELINKTGESLNQIEENVKRAMDSVTQVSTASEEQSVTADEIAKNIAAVAAFSKETNSAAEQTSDSSDQLSKLVEDIRGIVGQFKLQPSSSTSDNI